MILVGELFLVMKLLWFGHGSLCHMTLCLCVGIGPRGSQD